MTRVLLRKLLVDVRLTLTVVCVLLFAFQTLWALITWRISGEILPSVVSFIPIDTVRNIIFKGPGQAIQALMGGSDIKIEHAGDLMTVAYVHPLTLIILSIWAVGRASQAIAGEIDRGTMELLLAQPIRRGQVILAHILFDLVTVPLLCLSMWLGTCFGTWSVGLQETTNANLHVDPSRFLPALMNVLCFLLAISGYSLWMSAAGRFRNRVLGLAILITLLQFLVNVIGQPGLLDALAPCRPFTVFYHYQPQSMILHRDWAGEADTWIHLGALLGVAALGYGLAWWTFCKRDLPAPL